MAASNASTFPPQNAAFRLAVAFRDNTGALITGWTGASVTAIVADGSLLANSGGTAYGTPTEVSSTGLGYLDLNAAQMNGQLIQVACTITNTNAKAFAAMVYTGGVAQMTNGLATASEVSGLVASVWAQAEYGDAPGRATTVLQQIAQIWRAFFNAGTSNTLTQTMTLYRDDSVTPLMSGGITVNSTIDTRAKFS